MEQLKKVEDAFLYSHSLFGGLTAEELDVLRSFFKEEKYNERDAILNQGEPNSKVFFIIEGEVTICKHPSFTEGQAGPSCERIISKMGPGDTFGEMELIDIQPCAASVFATTPTRVLTFTNADLYQLSKSRCKTFAMIMMNLAREVSRRLRKTDEDLAYLLYTRDDRDDQ